jgi:mono/diheme cytochrome c family protein
MIGWSLALGIAVVDVRAQGQPAPQIRLVEKGPIVSLDGKDNFAAFCAVCHGADGSGNGPAVAALKVPVPALTTIAKRHGKFDPIAIERLVTGRDRVPPAHGTVGMPIWGPVFRGNDMSTTLMTLRLKNLVEYLQSIQTD